MTIASIGTYLPVWGSATERVCGADEDAVTLAVEAGRAALHAAEPQSVPLRRVVLVTRDLPLLEGGNGPALLAGLGLDPGVEVVEQIGGAPAVLDQLVTAGAGTLVIGADSPAGNGAGSTGGCGAAAAWIADSPHGLALTPVARVQRSLPVRARGNDGVVHEYEDPRLLRERGVHAAVVDAGIAAKAVAVAGLGGKEAAALGEGGLPRLPTLGASAPLFALAALADRRTGGLVLAFEQASMSAVDVPAGAVALLRREPPARPVPVQRVTPGPEIRISLPAYERAFDAKVRLEAARCPTCATLSLPPRRLCLGCGAEGVPDLVALPRDAVVYTTTTVHTPVPGLATPYSIVIVELGGSGVRLLAQVTGAEPGSVAIGDRGTMVLRRVAERAGVPDYGYSFAPDANDRDSHERVRA